MAFTEDLDHDVVTPVPRRERLRASTLAEIRAVARRLLVAEGPEGVTLRAIAREMGLTAPALYRYHASREDLVRAVAVDCYAEVVAAMEAAHAAVPAQDLPGRLLAAARAFRRWALANPSEFGLLFGTPMGRLVGPCEGELEAAAQRFGQVFARLFLELLASPAGLPVPADSEVDPAFAQELRQLDPQVAGMLPLGAQYVFVRCWTRLYGCVCLEVFGHLSWAVQDGEPVFEDTLRDLAGMLGMADAYRPPRRS